MDTGVGMTKSFYSNLGTVALHYRLPGGHGLERLLHAMIGQVGVGFYSAFFVTFAVTRSSSTDEAAECSKSR